MSSDRVLCVDDDPSILAAYQRGFRKLFTIDTAPSGDEALKLVRERGPYAVAVVDMHMPGMDGVQLLARLREAAPDTVRMMLTGADDQGTAMAAVNDGQILRFLTKPCPPDQLARAIDAGIRQHRLVTAERELLEKTLTGSVRLLTEILALIDPESFGRAQQQRERIRQLMTDLKADGGWEVEMAAMLAPIGLVTVPPAVTLKARSGQPLDPVEQEMVQRSPEVAARLLANIPRLEGVARLVRAQHQRFDGDGGGEAIPVGARVLKLLGDLSQLELAGESRVRALGILKGRAGWYDPRVIDTAIARFASDLPVVAEVRQQRPVRCRDLRIGMVLRSDITTADGKLLIGAGHVLSETLLERLANFARIERINEPITIEEAVPVRVP